MRFRTTGILVLGAMALAASATAQTTPSPSAITRTVIAATKLPTVIGAKTVQRRGGKLLLLSPQTDVEQVLETIGVTDLLPIVRDEAEAMAAIRT